MVLEGKNLRFFDHTCTQSACAPLSKVPELADDYALNLQTVSVNPNILVLTFKTESNAQLAYDTLMKSDDFISILNTFIEYRFGRLITFPLKPFIKYDPDHLPAWIK